MLIENIVRHNLLCGYRATTAAAAIQKCDTFAHTQRVIISIFILDAAADADANVRSHNEK